MPLQVSAEDFESLLGVVARFSFGASVSELLALPEVRLSKRTLQRRLEQLVVQRRVVSIGQGRARRYGVPATPAASTELVAPTQPEAWLSAEATEIRTAVRRPLNQRTPVGYHLEFLAGYQPNRTFYLPAELRGELEKLGQVGMTDLPAGTHLRKVMDRLLIDLSWNSSRLEGNTYSLLETQRLLELGESAEGKKAEETQMILNHKAAIELLAEQSEEVGFNRHTICSLHALLSDNLLSNSAAGGRLRDHGVGIGGSVFHPLEQPQQIAAQFEEMLSKAARIEDAFEQSFFIMVHLPYLQPFEDVNKRTSRLAANISLVRRNLGPLSFVDVPKDDYLHATLAVYELNRVEYLRDVFVWAYRRSCVRYAAIRQVLGEPDPFRLRHRLALMEVIADVVRGGMDKVAAVAFLKKRVPELVESHDADRFMILAETELAGLHEGNFARFRIRPSEFERWRANWK